MNEARYLVFDIETVADGRLVQRINYPEERGLSPKEAVDRYSAERLEKTGSTFIPHTFHVPVSVAIARVAADYSLLDLVTLDRPKFRPQVIAQQFWKGWHARKRPTLVTFNGRGFDMPVMELAAFRYGVPIPGWMQRGAKSWEDPRGRYCLDFHEDLQDVVSAFGGSRVNGGLNLMAALCGKPGKLATKGEMVQQLWDEGEHLRIDDYCCCDALDTYFVFLRLRVLQGDITLEQEKQVVEQAHGLIARRSEEVPILKDYLDAFSFWSTPDDDGWPFLDSADSPES
jgi:predicted PolB exonuclease-like 3'-5' exonuclease